MGKPSKFKPDALSEEEIQELIDLETKLHNAIDESNMARERVKEVKKDIALQIRNARQAFGLDVYDINYYGHINNAKQVELNIGHMTRAGLDKYMKGLLIAIGRLPIEKQERRGTTSSRFSKNTDKDPGLKILNE